MATVIGKTSEKIDELLDELVETGAISGGGALTLTTRGGTVISLGTIPTPLSAWPVGSIFMSVVATNPNTLLGGGTWTAWGTGRVPVGIDTGDADFNTVEETGGFKTHTLTTGEMPSHTHAIDHDHASATTSSDSHDHTVAIRYSENGDAPGSGYEYVRDVGGITGGGGSAGNAHTSSDAHTHTLNLPNFTGSSGSAGTGGAHNNLQPYITCYMWKRVS